VDNWRKAAIAKAQLDDALPLRRDV